MCEQGVLRCRKASTARLRKDEHMAYSRRHILGSLEADALPLSSLVVSPRRLSRKMLRGELLVIVSLTMGSGGHVVARFHEPSHLYPKA